MQVNEVDVKDARVIVITTRNSVYTCGLPDAGGQRDIFLSGKKIFNGVIYGIAVLPKVAERILAHSPVKALQKEPLPDGRQAVAIGTILVGHGAVFHFTNPATQTLSSYATSDITGIDVK